MDFLLFEYQNRIKLPEDVDIFRLDSFLDQIWKNRYRNIYTHCTDDQQARQQFISFDYKNRKIRANNFVGVIRYGEHSFQILPKIFYSPSDDRVSEYNLLKINSHVLWYLSHCSKIKFPSDLSNISHIASDIIEVFIYLFSKYTRDLLYNNIYQTYHIEEKPLDKIRGQIDFEKYLSKNFVTGNWHKIDCRYKQFGIDNKFNQIIKYVSKMLLQTATTQESQKYLREILFMLSETSDRVMKAGDCDTICFGQYRKDYEVVLEYCRLFLAGSVSFQHKEGIKLFALLLPMDYIFEIFVYEFIKKHVCSKAICQDQSKWLDEQQKFRIRPDIIIPNHEKPIVIDTKYKLINNNSLQADISQSDLYQMLAYAIRLNADKLILLYPENQLDKQKSGEQKNIIVRDIFADKNITIQIHKIPLIDTDIDTNTNETIQQRFRNLEARIRRQLHSIIKD